MLGGMVGYILNFCTVVEVMFLLHILKRHHWKVIYIEGATFVKEEDGCNKSSNSKPC